MHHLIPSDPSHFQFVSFSTKKCVQICVGCCDVDYCNEEMAHNESSAIFQRTRTAAFSAAGPTGRGSDAFHSIWMLSSILLTLALL